MVKQELSIGASLPIQKIGQVLKFFSETVQIILHKPKCDGTFQILMRYCTRIPHEPQGNKKIIHFGYIEGHYFLIKDIKDL
jgi:hypothetical protein